MQDHKNDVISTRVGHLGGSDAKLIQTVAEAGMVPDSTTILKRLAVCKGLIEHEQFSNPAIEFGNFVEEQVYESLHSKDSRWQSNPCLVSEKYSREGVKVIDHVDFLLVDDEKKVVLVSECKATRLSFEATRQEYKWQLCHHYVMASEYAKKLGNYSVRLSLCHYDTSGIDLTAPFEFDPQRLTVKQLRNTHFGEYRIAEGMNIIEKFLAGFNEYYAGEEIDASYLPADVKKQFDEVTTLLNGIKAREEAVNEFKAKLYDFMTSKGIKGIKNDLWSITVVAPSETKSFNSKKFLEDYTAKHPRKALKLKEQYTSVSKRKGYVTIKTKDGK